jgi:hypothetical protein
VVKYLIYDGKPTMNSITEKYIDQYDMGNTDIRTIKDLMYCLGVQRISEVIRLHCRLTPKGEYKTLDSYDVFATAAFIHGSKFIIGPSQCGTSIGNYGMTFDQIGRLRDTTIGVVGTLEGKFNQPNGGRE